MAEFEHRQAFAAPAACRCPPSTSFASAPNGCSTTANAADTRCPFPTPSASGLATPVHASFANNQLTFTNIGAYNFIALPDRQVAQDFAARYGFDTHADTAANVILEVVFRLVDAPPGADSQTAVIRARILAGRIVSSQGQLIQAFPSNQVALSAATVPGAALGPHLDTVKADTIQNIRIGMPQADAAARARVAHPDAACDNAANYDAYFNGIQGSATA